MKERGASAGPRPGWMHIHGWEQWQSYRTDRGRPPWIKVHRAALANPKWVALSDAERGQLVCIWLVAADNHGWVPADAETLQKLARLSGTPDVSRFIEAGFFEPPIPGAAPTPSPELDVEKTPGSARGVAGGLQVEVAPEPKPTLEPEPFALTPPTADKVRGWRFEEFWNVYPVKKGKQRAEKLWKSRNLDPVAAQIIADVQQRMAHDIQWQRGYVPHGSTYVSQSIWRDEIRRGDTKVETRHEQRARVMKDIFSMDVDAQASRTINMGDADVIETRAITQKLGE